MKNKSYELQCLDYACVKTIEKGGDYNSISHISNAINKLTIEGYTLGFTSNEDARNYIKNLDSDKIEKELILNLIKQKACEDYYKMTVLETTKTFDDELTSQESGFLMYNVLKDEGMESLKWILNKYPRLYLDLSMLFAETRYFNQQYTINKLDNDNIYKDIDKSLLNKVDTYYENFNKEMQGMNK